MSEPAILQKFLNLKEKKETTVDMLLILKAPSATTRRAILSPKACVDNGRACLKEGRRIERQNQS